VNPITVAFVVAALAGIGAAGVIGGFVRGDPLALEPPPDPLEDRRLELDRSLEDLEDARAAGALEPARYAALREDTDVRIARVRRALERRSAADTVERPAPPTRRPGTVPPWAVGVLIAATTIAVVVAGLAHSTTPAPSAVPGSNASDPLAFFEQRVREHPQDVAARLDLASRYLGAGRPRDALVQYAAVLRLDPTDAEAHARIGVIEYLAGRPKAALASVRRALETDPTYPEALFFEGAILLNGLDHPAAAIEAFQKYLASAPFGGERGRATQLIARAQRELRRAERAG
jgi:tetratricopeptide (TPR) repeat protein